MKKPKIIKDQKSPWGTTRPDKWRLLVQNYRDMHARGFTEAICEHGVGHHKGVHGCDGCCASWPKEISSKVTKD